MSPDEQRRFRSNELAELIFSAWFLAERMTTEIGTPLSRNELIGLRCLLTRAERLLAEFREPPTVNNRPLPDLRKTVSTLRVTLEPATISERSTARCSPLLRPVPAPDVTAVPGTNAGVFRSASFLKPLGPGRARNLVNVIPSC
jgi:hypothetical protein